ncbi:hypothetical protein Tc00.1047053510625.70 [Trypanosoma cruzi]|uniref:Uncharacterized protein n=1 Tax=Trypanosoma cruzi (strain CL Brener) TaxID=353153 RepID=Q4DYT5_TRYCC|nr:hypothetical protein Tc00.1047053510625.70 [Trypanosoma cruzi]EAN97680.1 hypothetical protein Tc00.1047053510625.70 [Trypanosoma cruzi]|eukprot:XP_819531.1 hypothetical protein [Trypanosoma cruzi strain CL Brener]
MNLLLPVCVATPAEGEHKREGCRRCVCVQVPCNNVTTKMLRLGDPRIVVVLTNSRGTAHIDALSGRSEASFEVLQGAGCVGAATTCMERHDGTVSCGWWIIFFSKATERERERAAPAVGVVAAFCGLPCRLLSVR